MKVLMTGGGTGGHVYPAIAIADTIRSKIPDVEIAFVGTPRGIENRICKAEKYPIYHVNVMGIRRSLSFANIKALYLAKVSPIKARKIISEFKPDIVIGTGGYVCWPITVAAAREGIPTLLHESNVFPGLAVRKLQDKVDRILLNFAESKKHLKNEAAERALCVGNPLRGGFGSISRGEARKAIGVSDATQKIILSYGGSRGAQRMNEAIFEFMKEFAPKNPNVLHIHSTGDIGAEEFRDRFAAAGLDKLPNIKLYDYIEDMPTKMAAADLVICRAGAMTVSEISMMKKAAIFIPSPNVAENHQYKNAKLLADKNAALVIEEKELTAERLYGEIDSLLKDDERRSTMSDNVGAFSNPNANKLIFDEVMRLVNLKMK